jgi:hypothetical protein
MQKTWVEKLNSGAKPEVKSLGKSFQGFPVGAKLLIPTPLMVRDYVMAIPYGESRTAGQMRADLAAANGADTMCPLCAGIFLRIVAEASFESGDEVPYWRMLDAKSPTRKKLSFGTDFVDSQRASESL